MDLYLEELRRVTLTLSFKHVSLWSSRWGKMKKRVKQKTCGPTWKRGGHPLHLHSTGKNQEHSSGRAYWICKECWMSLFSQNTNYYLLNIPPFLICPFQVHLKLRHRLWSMASWPDPVPLGHSYSIPALRCHARHPTPHPPHLSYSKNSQNAYLNARYGRERVGSRFLKDTIFLPHNMATLLTSGSGESLLPSFLFLLLLTIWVMPVYTWS